MVFDDSTGYWRLRVEEAKRADPTTFDHLHVADELPEETAATTSGKCALKSMACQRGDHTGNYADFCFY